MDGTRLKPGSALYQLDRRLDQHCRGIRGQFAGAVERCRCFSAPLLCLTGNIDGAIDLHGAQGPPCDRERRIERNGALKVRDRRLETVRPKSNPRRTSPKIRIVRRNAARHTGHPSECADAERDLERARDRRCDLVLDHEDLGKLTLIGF
jgi:hypothetical protein